MKTRPLDEKQYKVAVSHKAFYLKVLGCECEFKGEKTWWDYKN